MNNIQEVKSIPDKIAVLFPGIGYTCHKPLLYYGGRLAQQKGYTVREVPYGNFPANVKGDPLKMYACFISARNQAEDILKDVDWSAYKDIVFISKSVGTAAALSYAQDHRLTVRHVLYTPLEETFRFPVGEAIAFHGTADPWAETERLARACEERQIPLYLTEGANHSLECGKVRKDLKEMRRVMKITADFLDK